MQGEHPWQNLNSTAMAGINFDGTYQQQGLSLQFLSSHYNPVPNSELSSVYSPEPTARQATPGQPETIQVKKELQAVIKMKYRDSELPRIEKREPEPPKPQKKQKEDPEVIKRRRERNKIAATKCRRRKKERIATLEKRTNKIRAETRLLEEERAKLLREKQALMDSFNNHCCKLPQAWQWEL